MSKFIIFIELCLVLSPVLCGVETKTKIIIDNDAGGDDSMAIFLTLQFEKYFDGPKLVALTTGNGNTNENNVHINNQKILKIANRQDIPIYRGSTSSLVITPTTNDYYGRDGMGDAGDNFTDLIPARGQSAVLALIELSKLYKHQLTVITIGTLTNVALAIKLDPDFLRRLKHLYVAAGHVHDENYPNPEFNAFMDSEAYYVITQHASPAKVTVFPFSQTKASIQLTKEWRQQVLGAIETSIMKAQNKHEQVALARPGLWNALDPAAIAVTLKEDLVKEYKYSKNSIVLCGDRRGFTTHEFREKNDSNVRIVFLVKQEEYTEFLFQVFQSGN